MRNALFQIHNSIVQNNNSIWETSEMKEVWGEEEANKSRKN